jgi:hypothetical protein
LVPVARYERIWNWLLRLVLPVTLGLCGQLIAWMWFRTPYPLDAWSISGGVVLIVVSLLLAVWTWHSWLPFGQEVVARSSGLHVRHLILAMVAIAVFGGLAGLNAGSDRQQAKARITVPA